MEGRKLLEAQAGVDKPKDDENDPELTEEDFAMGRPFKEVFPRQRAALMRQGGRPQFASLKGRSGSVHQMGPVYLVHLNCWLTFQLYIAERHVADSATQVGGSFSCRTHPTSKTGVPP